MITHTTRKAILGLLCAVLATAAFAALAAGRMKSERIEPDSARRSAAAASSTFPGSPASGSTAACCGT